uniref:accessory Sec system protein Asp2 n=1 Tax=Staphylococcus capitis TaxID=29388 RepID=UPI0028CB81F7
DDYDDIGFDDLMCLVGEWRRDVMRGGVGGRDNDDWGSIRSWFVKFYDIILNNELGRE